MEPLLNRLRHQAPLTMALGLVFAWMAVTPAALASGPQQEGTTYTVLAGYEEVTSDGLEVQAFLPEDVTIKVGDTINWRFTQLEPHTVTFLGGEEPPDVFIGLADGRIAENPRVAYPSGNPSAYDGSGYLNSGFAPPDTGPEGFEYGVTFTSPGAYDYVCMIHPFMTGTVSVMPESSPPVFDPGIVEQNGEDQKQQFIEELDEVRARVGSPESAARPDGTAEHIVLTGMSTEKADLMYFDRPDLTIAAGDTVTWTWDATTAPHNVMFVPQGQDAPEFITPEPQEDGLPNLLVNPVVAQPAGGSVFQPSQMFNSGLRFNEDIPPLLGFASGGDYSLTFNEPGTYAYLCSLHARMGMVGRITVEPEQPTPPSVRGYAPSSLAMAGAGVSGLGLVVAGVWVLMRRTRSQE